ncbi:fibrobacter succinogenes major paralogous domain-containing protein [Candidatus Uhrbacteria bacterium]|nr:fibrobacter succinogenes major paralogous domain-containing protein [Candidatus Uhrbacteria bacterium]
MSLVFRPNVKGFLVAVIFVFGVLFSFPVQVQAQSCPANIAYEGETYPAVQIGTQCWMAKNLNVGTFISSGGSVAEGCLDITNGTQFWACQGASGIQKYCQNNQESACTTYGGYYEWAEMMGFPVQCNNTNFSSGSSSCSTGTTYSISQQHRGICPAGWHIPTEAEWHTLELYLTDSNMPCAADRYSTNEWSCSSAGTKLRTGGSSGFDGLLAGWRYMHNSFIYPNEQGQFWSASKYNNSYHAWTRIINNTDVIAQRPMETADGFSVRCVLDSCTSDDWACSDWGSCSTDGMQSRSCTKSFDCPAVETSSPATSQPCVPTSPAPDRTPPILSPVSITSSHAGQPSLATNGDTVNLTFSSNEPLFWFAVNWNIGGQAVILPGGYINLNGNTWEAHLHVKAEDSNGLVGFTINYEDVARNSGTTVIATTDGSFVIVNNTRECTLSDWTCGSWSACSSSGSQNRICAKIANCESGITPSLQQNCSSSQPICTDFTYSDWGLCTNGWQFRDIVATAPMSCTGGNPVVSQPCQIMCTESDWTCGDWVACEFGVQKRTCSKLKQCEGGVVPALEKSCPISCESNNGWNCTEWSECGPEGKQTRTCDRCKSNPGTSPTLEKQCVYKQPGKERFKERDVVVKGVDRKTLYYLAADGKRYVFPNASVFKSWFIDYTDVYALTDDQLFGLPLGGNITYRPGIKMVKIETDPKVYAVAPNGVLRWVVSEKIAEQLYGFDWNKKIDDVPDVFFINYSFGSDIHSASDFDPISTSAAATSVNDEKKVLRSDKPRLSDTKPDVGEGKKK